MIDAFVRWTATKALPVWFEQGFDRNSGQFHERLSAGGAPLPVPYRAMVQARQIFVYASAASLGWFDGGEAAIHAMDRLRRVYAKSEGQGTSIAYSADAGTGAIRSSVRDAYTHAFVLFATAHLHRLTGAPELLDFADEITRFIEAELADPQHGGLVDALPLPANGAPKRQNPHMHLLEAYLALEEAAPGRGYLGRAQDLVKLFKTRLFHAGHGVLLEHFAANWSEHPDPAKARVFEPGHHYEWIWLLHHVERLSGEALHEVRAALHSPAAHYGHSPRGLIFDEVDVDGTPAQASHRLWPLTEAIKAAGVQHLQGDPAARGFADRSAKLLTTHFLDEPFIGGWIDHRHPDLSPRVDYVPASSLYHLFLAATEAMAAFAEERAPEKPADHPLDGVTLEG